MTIIHCFLIEMFPLALAVAYAMTYHTYLAGDAVHKAYESGEIRKNPYKWGVPGLFLSLYDQVKNNYKVGGI